MSSGGERMAGHGDALGQKFIVIDLRCIHVHIVQNDAKPQTGEARDPSPEPQRGGRCPWAAWGWRGPPRSMVEGNHRRAALAARGLRQDRGPNPLGPSEPGASDPALRRLQRGLLVKRGKEPSGRWTRLQGTRRPPPGLRGVHRPGWGRILRSPLSPSAPPLRSTAP